MIAIADLGLYDAKDLGGNRIVPGSPEPDGGAGTADAGFAMVRPAGRGRAGRAAAVAAEAVAVRSGEA